MQSIKTYQIEAYSQLRDTKGYSVGHLTFLRGGDVEHKLYCRKIYISSHIKIVSRLVVHIVWYRNTSIAL